jgi:hypothetical protein
MPASSGTAACDPTSLERLDAVARDRRPAGHATAITSDGWGDAENARGLVFAHVDGNTCKINLRSSTAATTSRR